MDPWGLETWRPEARGLYPTVRRRLHSRGKVDSRGARPEYAIADSTDAVDIMRAKSITASPIAYVPRRVRATAREPSGDTDMGPTRRGSLAKGEVTLPVADAGWTSVWNCAERQLGGLRASPALRKHFAKGGAQTAGSSNDDADWPLMRKRCSCTEPAAIDLDQLRLRQPATSATSTRWASPSLIPIGIDLDYGISRGTDIPHLNARHTRRR